MKIKILIGILLVLIVINLGTIGTTYLYLQLSRNNNPPHGQIWRPSRPPDQRPEIRLNKQQRSQLEGLVTEFQAENQEIRNQIQELERMTFDLLQEESVPMNQINQNLQQISHLKLKLMEGAIMKMIKAKSFLDPEQQKRFFNFIIESRPAIPFRPRFRPGLPLPARPRSGEIQPEAIPGDHPRPGIPPAGDADPIDINEFERIE